MPGIGKTTSIHCLAHQMLGDAYKEGVLELNASDERYALPFISMNTLTNRAQWNRCSARQNQSVCSKKGDPATWSS